MENNLLDRTAKCQRVLEEVLTNDMDEKEIVTKTLKLSVQAGLPIKCFDILESWALRTYSHH